MDKLNKKNIDGPTEDDGSGPSNARPDNSSADINWIVEHVEGLMADVDTAITFGHAVDDSLKTIKTASLNSILM